MDNVNPIGARKLNRKIIVIVDLRQSNETNPEDWFIFYFMYFLLINFTRNVRSKSLYRIESWTLWHRGKRKIYDFIFVFPRQTKSAVNVQQNVFSLENWFLGVFLKMFIEHSMVEFAIQFQEIADSFVFFQNISQSMFNFFFGRLQDRSISSRRPFVRVETTNCQYFAVGFSFWTGEFSIAHTDQSETVKNESLSVTQTRSLCRNGESDIDVRREIFLIEHFSSFRSIAFSYCRKNLFTMFL